MVRVDLERITHTEVQQNWRKRNPEKIKEIDKRFYLNKKVKKMGKDLSVVDTWMEEWKNTGKVTYIHKIIVQ